MSDAEYEKEAMDLYLDIENCGDRAPEDRAGADLCGRCVAATASALRAVAERAKAGEREHVALAVEKAGGDWYENKRIAAFIRGLE